MQPKSERFEMRLDPETLEKVDAWRMRQADLPSRAEAVRRLMKNELSEMEGKPLKFSDGEKLITFMLCELFKLLKIDSEIDPSFVEDALRGGHYWGLEWKYPGIFDVQADSMETVREVLDVLDMWLYLEQSYANLSEKDRARVKEKAKPLGGDVVFPGFDGNKEIEHWVIAEFLIDKLDRFIEFGDRDLNSHMPSIDGYRRMVQAFKAMKPNLWGINSLSTDHIIEILNARRHNGI